MTSHEFIFSNQLRHRVTRHALFFLTFYLFLLLTANIPAHLFPNWRVEYNKAFVESKGGLYQMFLNRLKGQELWIFGMHMLLTWCIIYYLLPAWFDRRKKWLFPTVVVLFVFIAFQAVHYFIVYQNQVKAISRNLRAGRDLPVQMRGTWDRMRVVLFAVCFNLAVVIGFAIAIKLMKRFWLKLKETEELAREKARAELQLLKAQIHPHFLFNTLNNIYFFTLNASPHAPVMLKKLSGMLHYILYECEPVLVPLEREINFLQDYIALETIRYSDRMQLTATIKGDSRNKFIPPLLLIPFVENAFKHGASKMVGHAEINMDISIEDTELFFLISNSKPVQGEATGKQAGLGLNNVKKRLQLLCPANHELKITLGPGTFTVQLKLSLSEAGIPKPATTEVKLNPDYAVA